MQKPIYIHIAESNRALPLGASHLFGQPDMPEEYAMPMIPLICQINLEELPDNDVLPSSGLLLIFADINYYSDSWVGELNISMYVSDPKSVAVIYIPKEDCDLLVRREDACKSSPKAVGIGFSRVKPSIDEPDLQMFGRSDHLEWETWPNPCENWIMLFQMDSMEEEEYSYNFIDWGVLCILVSHKSVSTLDFSDARGIILSS